MAKEENMPTKNVTLEKPAGSQASVTRRSSAKGGRNASTALMSKLEVQQSLLSQLKTCNEILLSDPEDRAVINWKERIEFMLSSQSMMAFDDVIEDMLVVPALRTPIDFPLPSDSDQQALVGLAFAESSGTALIEITAIIGCLVNVAYYAAYEDPPKQCYNGSFGDGTILSAIKKSSLAYGSTQWRRIMNGDVLLSKEKLEQTLIPSEVSKLKACCEAVADVSKGNTPYQDTTSGRFLVQFNQATNSPPSTRQEKVAKYGVHTFYAFKTGRECQ